MKQKVFYRAAVLLLAAVLAAGALAAPAQADDPAPWAAAEVALAISHGLVPEDIQNYYSADISRRDFCRIAVLCLEEADRVNNFGLTYRVGISFTDTQDPDVLKAAGLGIVHGDDTGAFHPDRGITRQEAAIMLYNTLTAMGAPLDTSSVTFADQANIAPWATDQVSGIVNWGVMSGTGGNRFSPLGGYTREQAYVTISRLLSSVYMYLDAYKLSLSAGESIQLHANYSTGSPYAQWASSDPSVVSVSGQDQEATVTALQAGTANVTCLSNGFQLQCTISVEELTVSTGTDFTGAKRTYYSNDIAWDLCRQIEEDIGIQIFYLPEFDNNIPDANITHASYDYVTLNSAYFQQVYNELSKMKAAFDLYPDGLIREIVAKKGTRKTEIILFPSAILINGEPFMSYGFFGTFVYDYSPTRVDRIYYTGQGDPYNYSHEMGHMVDSAVMIANGWNASTQKWEQIAAKAGPEGYVSSYAMTSRPEDAAETWAYLWHYRDQVDEMLATGQCEVLREKIAYLTQLLNRHYAAASLDALPWSYMVR